jgi:hypothetical protein
MNEKYERYRRQVLRCKEMALKAVNPEIRADWLKLAAGWLEMIPLEHRSGQDAFAAIMKRDGTRQ